MKPQDRFETLLDIADGHGYVVHTSSGVDYNHTTIWKGQTCIASREVESDLPERIIFTPEQSNTGDTINVTQQ